MQVGLSLWVALSATLDGTFISMGADPPRTMRPGTGLIAVGVAFVLMTLIGLASLVRMSSSRASVEDVSRGGCLGGATG
jgi:hypothetical protein